MIKTNLYNDKYNNKELPVGVLLLDLYILSSYIAQNIVFPSKIITICLYLFVGYSILAVIVSGKITVTRFTVWYGMFSLISFVTLLYSPALTESGNGRSLLVVFVLTLCIQSVVKDREIFYNIAIIHSVASAIFIALLFATGNLNTNDGVRLGENILGNANKFATIIMIAFMYESWLLVYHKNNIFCKILLICGMLLNMIALLMSGGRKFIIIPILFLYILLLLRKNKHGKRKIIKYTIAIAVIVFVLYYVMMNVPGLYKVVGSRMKGLFNSFTGEGRVDNSTTIRGIMRKMAFEAWLDSPIFGHGFNSFKYLNRQETGHFYYSHCNYTELLYNGGIIIFIAYYWFYFSVLIKAFKCKQVDIQYRAFAIGTVLSLLVFEYGAVDYNMIQTVIMLMLAEIGLVIGEKETKSENLSSVINCQGK